jgi:NADPH:quinone reductase-like Zn-dependent oxidoreductase
MRAAYTEANGGPEQLKVGDLPDPDPGDSKLLVRNHAAGIGPWDWKMMGRGTDRTFPYIPGYEVGGVVEKAPEGSNFSVGDEVWGRAMGAWAEYVVSRGSGLVHKPANIGFEGASSLVIGAATAYEGLIDRKNLQPGESVLVVAAAGGVGTAAVQIAASAGARVIGVASAANFDFVRSLGAEQVFDYHDAAWADTVLEAIPGGVDVIFDAVGGETSQQALKAVKDGGRGAFVAWPLPEWEAEGRGIEGEGFAADASKERFVAINKLIEEGKLKPQVTETLPLDQAREALEKNQLGHTRGKIVLTI